jgi:hypothetical protein
MDLPEMLLLRMLTGLNGLTIMSNGTFVIHRIESLSSTKIQSAHKRGRGVSVTSQC